MESADTDHQGSASAPKPKAKMPAHDDDDASGAIIRPYGYAETECGYCKGSRASLLENNDKDSTNCSKSYSVLADTMTPSVYEGFMNRGWRRSGIHLYKPCNFESCCPTISIRLNVQNFHPTKSQRKVSNKMTNLLTTNSKSSPSTTKKPTNNKRPLPSKGISSSSASNASAGIIASSGSSGVLNDLEDITKKAVTDVLLSISKDHSMVEEKKKNSWKTSYRILQQSKQGRRKNQVHAVSTICAQLSGMYKNLQEFPNRDDLVRDVVDKMISNIEETMKQDKHGSNSSSSKNILQSKNGKVEVSSINGDERSGQIRVVLQVSSATSSATGDADGDVAMDVGDNVGGVKAAVHEDNLGGHDEKLDQWYHERKTIPSMMMTSINNSGDSGSSSSTSNDQFNIPEKKPRLGSSVSSSNFPIIDNEGGSDDRRHGGPAVKKELTITTVAAHQSALMPDVHRLYTWYQNAVHGDDDPFATNPKKETTTTSTTDPMETDSNNNNNESTKDIEIDLEEKEDSESDIIDPAGLDWGNAPTYFKEQIHDMLKNYLGTIDDSKKQQRVLKNYYSFYQFLVEAPFPFKQPQQTQPIDASSTGGLYHQQYRLGGVLIAVGVVDILPSGLSSVYLYYDPIFSQKFVPMGKYAILKEIEYTRQTLKLPYYYLGYYIESCQKMRYKAEYKPSELLCPKFYRWVDADIAIPKLQKTPRQVCSLVDGPEGDGEGDDDVDDDDDGGDENVVDETILNSGIQMDIGAGLNVTMEMLQPSGIDIVKPILTDFLKESGSELAVQCVVKLS